MSRKTIDSFSNEFDFLSNFYWVNVKVKDPDGNMRTAPSTEHAFQAAKATTVEDFNRVLNASSFGKSKRAGRNIKLRGDWESIKFNVMLDLLRQKFSRDDLRKLLLDTGDAELIEGNNWHDTTFGVCICSQHKGEGRNMLGKLLMQVREEIRRET